MAQSYVITVVAKGSYSLTRRSLNAQCAAGGNTYHSEGFPSGHTSYRSGTRGPLDATREHLLPSGLKMVEKGSQTGL